MLLWRMLEEHKMGITAVQEHHIRSKSILQSQNSGQNSTTRIWFGGSPDSSANARWSATDVAAANMETECGGVYRTQADIGRFDACDRDAVKVLARQVHHDASVRRRQWEQLGQKLAGTSVPLITLCDHKLHALPGADSEGLRESKVKVQLADRARQHDVAVTEKWGLHDAWDVVYGENEDGPSGFTFTWNPKPRNGWRPRRLDRLHVASSLQEYVQGAHNTTAVASDHKEVIVQFEQPPLQRVPPRTRFPTESLRN